MRGERSKYEKIVIIKNLFAPELFEKDVHLILDYQNDLREECSKCGTVKKVIIYDVSAKLLVAIDHKLYAQSFVHYFQRHPDGVAQVNMSDPEEADVVIQMMDRRFFGSRRLIAETWDGKTKYK